MRKVRGGEERPGLFCPFDRLFSNQTFWLFFDIFWQSSLSLGWLGGGKRDNKVEEQGTRPPESPRRETKRREHDDDYFVIEVGFIDLSDKERNDFPIIRCKNIGILEDLTAILCLKSLSLDLQMHKDKDKDKDKDTRTSWRRGWTSTSDPREVPQLTSREVLKMGNSTWLTSPPVCLLLSPSSPTLTFWGVCVFSTFINEQTDN